MSQSDYNQQLVQCSIEALSGNHAGEKYSFPITKCELNGSQDIVQHKYTQIGGASIESTGANPTSFKISAPFLTGLRRGSLEDWGDLYPRTFAGVYTILSDTVSPLIEFTHPTMGKFLTKSVHYDTPVVENIKNGQILDFELITTLSDEQVSNHVSGGASSDWGNAKIAAQQYDDLVVNLQPPPPSNSPIRKFSLTDMVNGLQGVIDSTALFLNTISSPIQNALYQIKQLKGAVLRLEDAAGAGLLRQLNQVESGVYSLVNNQPAQAPEAARLAAAQQRSQSLSNASVFNKSSQSLRQLKVYSLEDNLTLSQVSLIVKNSITDLINLNPGVSKAPLIRSGTQVVYFS